MKNNEKKFIKKFSCVTLNRIIANSKSFELIFQLFICVLYGILWQRYYAAQQPEV